MFSLFYGWMTRVKYCAREVSLGLWHIFQLALSGIFTSRKEERTMVSNETINNTTKISRRQTSLITGISLLLMTIPAPIATFGSIMNLIVEGDPTAT